MGRRRMTKRQRRLVLWANVLLVAGFSVWHFGVATLFVVETRYVGWKFPAVQKTPVELTDLSISQVPGRKLSYFGYEFEVPWDDLDQGKMKQVGKGQLIAFRSGNALLFSKAAPKEFVQTFLSTTKVGPDKVRSLWGEEALRSDYSLHLLILEATPGEVSLFTRREDAVRSSMLILFKGIMTPRGGESGIFRVRTDRFQGFQYGDPQARPKLLNVDIFADDGGLSFAFAQKGQGLSPAITQAEINRVIQTVRRLSEPGLSASR
jgi:hypothetical protein